jgi:2-iminoacetate synthase
MTTENTTPGSYKHSGKTFIDEALIERMLHDNTPSTAEVDRIIAKSLSKQRLDLEEVATLLNIQDPRLLEQVFDGARELKRSIYGNRIVLFAPLYIGNDCVNDCQYCGFRRSNRDARRVTLNESEVIAEVTALEEVGHKRLILVFGEHPRYDADFIADMTRLAYSVNTGSGEIRRVNINAAPLSVEDYRKVGAAGIGTYQVFQETYHRETYGQYHPHGTKSNYDWRLYALDRAMEAGLGDVGIGALFGLYDWRFEVMGLVAHTIHLEEEYNVGPHTISFPRFQDAQTVVKPEHLVSDEEFKHLVAVLRLAVPYTGLILTARESVAIRDEVIELGCSQIDAGSRIELGSYRQEQHEQELDREQFQLGDNRSLDEVMRNLLKNSYTPSFCTACYRLGRTGEEFMEIAIPGFIQRFCTPNALVTLKEYLMDYASDETRAAGEKAIKTQLDKIKDEKLRRKLEERLLQIEQGERDLYF